jgi:hypothetical protein
MTDQQFIAWLQSDDCIRCVLVEVEARVAGVETTLLLSNRPYTTGPGDTPAHAAYDACVVGGVRFSESLSLDGEPSISWGDIEIENADGSRDGWLDYVWINRRAQVWIGDPRWARADFRRVFDGVVGDIGGGSGDGSLSIHFLDKLQRLNVPMTEQTVGGDGANRDKLLPLTFGEAFNVAPLLVNAAELRYQVHAGQIAGIIEVRDNGAPITAVAPDLESGTFLLGAMPAGTVTASVQGDAPAGAGYSNNIADLVARIATRYGPENSRFGAEDLDLASLEAFAEAYPHPVGFFASERTNVLAACQELARSIGAHVVVTSQGLLRLVVIALPATGTPWQIGPGDMEADSFAIAERPPVRAAVKLGWCKNWTPQTGLVSGLPAESAGLMSQEWMTTTRADTATADVYRLDAEPEVEETLLLTEADAAAEAERRLALWSAPRTVFAAECFAHLLLAELGDAVALTHPRYGLEDGKPGVILSIERDWLGGRVRLGVLTGSEFVLPTPDASRPTQAGPIMFSDVTDVSARASWPAGADNKGIVGYQVSINGGVSWTNTAMTRARTVSGLPGQTITLMVRCRDAAGNFSDPISDSVTLAVYSEDWTPSRLFAGSEVGAWYDPSDFSSLFQDREGFVPVDFVGQKVGRMLDKSGNGIHWIALAIDDGLNTDTLPILSTDGHGRFWLEFDGSPDGFACEPMTLGSGPWTWTLALRRHHERPMTLLSETFKKANYAGAANTAIGTATDLAVVPTYTIDGVATSTNSRSTLSAALTPAANHIVEVSGLDLTAWQTFGFGAHWYDQPFQGRFYGGVLRYGLTSTELSNLRSYLALKLSASPVAPDEAAMPVEPAGSGGLGPEPPDPTAPEDLSEPTLPPDPTPFTPAKLFLAAEIGFWFDPGDLSSMWQDAGQTVPVTGPGQPVAFMADRSGNGFHWVRQAAGGDSRPILMQDEGGKFYLQFDGIDDGLTTVNEVIPAVNLDIFLAVRRDTSNKAVFLYSDVGGIYALGVVEQVPYHALLGTSITHYSLDAVDYPFTQINRAGLDDFLVPGETHVVEFRKTAMGPWPELAFGGYDPTYMFQGRFYGLIGRQTLSVTDRRKVQEWISKRMTPAIEMFPPVTEGAICLMPDGRGDQDGRDWANAMSFSPLMTFQRGFTYYLADGVYNFAGAGMAYGTPVNETARIYIKKATSNDHGPGGGWNTATMGSGQAVLRGTQSFTTGFWTIDGNRPVSRWSTTGYGIRIKVDRGPCVTFGDTNGNYAQGCELLRCELEGNGGDGAGPFPNQDGIAWYTGSHRTRVSRCFLHGMGRCHLFSGSVNQSCVIEYCRFGEYENNEAEHSEMASIWPHTTADWTFRYNLFTHCTGTGGLMMDGTGWDVYGNVFYKPEGGTWEGGNGTVGSWSGVEILQSCRIFNNTFINITNPVLSAWYIPLTESNISGNKFKNNLLVNCTEPDGVDFTWFPRHSHNHYIGTNPRQVDPNSTVGTGDPFEDIANYDFRIRANADVPPGLVLSDRYKYDANGQERVLWTRGAFDKVGA